MRCPRPYAALLVLFSLLALAAPPALARRGAPPLSVTGAGGPAADVARIALAERDRATLIADADTRQEAGHPLIFAEPIPVSITPATHGTTEMLADGSRLWRLGIDAPGATDLNLGLSRYRVPPGATLHVSSEETDYREGPYTHADNADHGELWLPVVPGSAAMVELHVPADAAFDAEIEIGQIGYGFRDLFRLEEPRIRQGSCNNDVICPEWDAWNDEEQAAAVYQLNGFWTCSGQMVMNTAADYTPYFLTANHCGISSGNDQTMVVYWNYESPNCGDLCCGSLSDNQTGAIFRAARSDVDFCLVELEEDPDPLSNVYWGGWDRTGVAPNGSIAIHHPSTDEKAISWNDDTLTTMNSCIGGGSNTHWRVNDWEDGTTEPGSSGSGLWHPDTHRIIGFLSGGIASCSLIGYDCYGKFSLAWSGSSSSSRLSDWLDPIGTGAMTFDGSFSDGAGRVQYLAAGGTDECATLPSNENGVWEPGETITIPVTVLAIGNHTGITGTLSTTTPGVTILDDTATWPNLSGGTSAVSNAPHFQILLDGSVPCASTVDLDLSLSSNEGGPWLSSIAHDVGGELTPVGLPVVIPDGVPAGVASPLAVSTDETLSDVEVYVKITHTRVGDLVLKLQSPLGTTVTLLDRPMYPQSPNGCPDDDMEVTFTDTFFANLDTHCGGSTPWWIGDAKPMTPLSAMDGESSAGTWNLIVEDHNGGETGFIDDWRLLTTPALPGVCEVCPTGGTDAPLVAGGESVFRLRQNRPNPFAERTEIRFRLPASAPTTLAVFDVTGRRIADLVDGEMPAGEQFVVWNGRNAQGRPVAGGIYFYRLTSGGVTEIKRMNLVR